MIFGDQTTPSPAIQSGGDGGTPGGLAAEYRRESKTTIGWVVKVRAAGKYYPFQVAAKSIIEHIFC